MLTHSQIWSAVDALASRFELSPSGLAKKAGLDPTSFNKSKRKTGDGRERWPSTESLSKILHATETTLQDFVDLISNKEQGGFAEERTSGSLELLVKNMPDPDHGAAIQLHEDHYAPLYRKGDTLILAKNKEVVPGQRVVITFADGTIRLGAIIKVDSKQIEAEILYKKKFKKTFSRQDIASIVQIKWVSQ